MASNPFELLVSIQQACEQNYLSFSSEKSFQWQGVLFTVGTAQFLTPLWQVAEIMPKPQIMPIPGTKDFMEGIAQVRGEIMLINDLSRFLEVEAMKSSHVLVIEKSTEKVGFAVTKVDRLMMVGYQKLGVYKQSNAYIERYVQEQTHTIPIVDFKILMDEPSFMQVRMPA